LSRAFVTFLWHMHQPFYFDRVSGEVSMPWVRLHACKGYYDMMALLEDFPHVRATFNVVPSLITQIDAYRDGTAKDKFLEHSSIPAKELTPVQKKFILREFFQANWDNMIRPHKRYWEIMSERGLHLEPDAVNDYTVTKFNAQAFLDVQVWFNLSWFGYRARKRFPELNDLIKKDRFFTEDEKRHVLSLQMQILGEIAPLYSRMQDSNQVELTTSPFYHPILPLLFDSEFTWRSMPGARLPERFCHPEDAQEQINKAVAFHTRIFGRAPKGMWPSEGSVCPEIIPLARNAGIEWIATDEAILAHSLKTHNIYDHLYAPYRTRFDGAEIDIIFRDRGLSDMVGFAYSRNKPRDACNDFLYRLRRIARERCRPETQPLVPIILDGENAWEYYYDSGESFLSFVYESLSKDDMLRTATVSGFLAENNGRRRVDNLYTGSWIGHNFDIWIGDPEENDAWNCINRTRKFLKRYEAKHGAEATGLALAWEELYAAEGSDWFWWYGPDFSTDNDAEFDRLFRMHLQNVFRAVNVDVPSYLFTTLLRRHKGLAGRLPVAFVQPKIDGRITDFFEWQGAGCYECARGDKALALGCRYLTHIYYGFDLYNLYMRFDLDAASGVRPEDISMRLDIYLACPHVYRLTMPLYPDMAKEKAFTLERSQHGIEFEKVRDYETIAWSKILELSIPFADLGLQPGQTIEMQASLKNDRIEMMRFPKEGLLKLTVPDENFEAKMWVV
jgi:alpha-amylase/alpha-mannosidase (GH57 family)